ncbi:MAG: dihydrodipicolinate synthase family protein [Acidobacteria bacterium]|nr:dihydrodipicolinate synthase family protein [Acidobacteriota bacterium]MDA1235400.1 dihydrodipicolinate synthase family protein [Acidobacteriota bacterium]
MSLHWTDWPDGVLAAIRRGVAIPASPLALDANRKFDPRRQRALTRYYVDAGAGGVAIGVHTTQFAIRDVGLYEPVLKLAAETVEDWTDRTVVRICGFVGKSDQALREAAIARDLGYHAGLLSLAAWKGASEDEIIEHCRRIADQIPIIGFYLQPAVGGVQLGTSFWRRFAEIENVVAIKMAPFNRYRTLDVIRGVVEARAEQRISLYTGNDDHIVGDLIVPFTFMRDGEPVTVRIVGGVLGHWSVWLKTAVELLERCQAAAGQDAVPAELLALDSQVTDCNSAFFDVANDFAGCIAGCHEVLRRQGLFEGIWCLNPDERLSPGQSAEIDRVYAAYPHFNDDAFVAANRERWLDG